MPKIDKWNKAHTVNGRRSPEKEMEDFFERKGITVICAKINIEDFQSFDRYLIL